MKIVFDLDDEIEIWEIIKDFPNYAISNFGKVKRTKKGINTYVGKILKQSKDSYGYLVLTLYKSGNSSIKKVHRLVMEAFKGPCPKGKQVNHKDGNKENPKVDNLEYVTLKQNMRHASKMGLLKGPRGESNGHSKLTEKKVKKIRKLHKAKKYYQYELADIYNISQSLISQIVNCKKWKHV